MKDDLFEKTKFKHNFKKEFLPPLNKKEDLFIKEKIFEWYQKYSNINLEYYTEQLKKDIKGSSKKIKNFSFSHNDDYEFIVEYLFLEELEKEIAENIKKMSASELINWQPKKGITAWEPPGLLFKNSLENIKETIGDKILEKIKNAIKDTDVKNKINYVIPGEKKISKENIVEEKMQYIKNNKNYISKQAIDKLIRLYYKNTFTFTVKRNIKFQNDLYKYLETEFGIQPYYRLLENTINKIDHFIDLESEKKLKNKLKEIHWQSFIHLMRKYYNTKTTDELNKLNEDIAKQTLNFYITIIVNINIKEKI